MLDFASSLGFITCPNHHPAAEICLSHHCTTSQPFICSNQYCAWAGSHAKCKSIKKEGFQQYLLHWKKFINNSGVQFIERMAKLFVNLRDKVNRQQIRFNDYCRQLFLGKDYAKLITLIERRQFSSITSKLLASSLRNVTQPIQSLQFKPFTLSQMSKIDKSLNNLFHQIQHLYKNKQSLQSQSLQLKRCNSATLQRTNPNTMRQANNEMFDLLKLKIDLNYPKLINSKIIKDGGSLNKLIGFKINKYSLVYRASQSHFDIKQFYRKNSVIRKQIQQKNAKQGKQSDLMNIIVVKSQFGKIIGGITQIKWQQPFGNHLDQYQEDEVNPEIYNKTSKIKDSKFKSDLAATTNMFSLDLMEKYQLSHPQEAIYCGKKSIGFGKSDLRIFQKGDQQKRNYCKFPNSYNYSKSPYMKTSKSGMNLSGCKYSPFFKIQQWECFIIEK